MHAEPDVRRGERPRCRPRKNHSGDERAPEAERSAGTVGRRERSGEASPCQAPPQEPGFGGPRGSRQASVAAPVGDAYNGVIMASIEVTITHDEARKRFCAELEGYEACLMYRLSGTEIDLYHTYVPEVFRGRGVAEKLCKVAFEYAKARQLTVIPSCSYVSGAYLKRHQEYEPLTKRGPASNPIVSG